MAGPFPGMDPYLEKPSRWSSVHGRLIPYLADMLNAVLPPRYVANIEERCYVMQPARSIYPDVVVRQQPFPVAQGGMVAVAEPVAAPETAFGDVPLIVEALPFEPREPFINILNIEEDARIVCAIEILSPANKAAGEGRQMYLRKQQDVLASRTHLIEIDLLRSGEHTVAVPLAMLPKQPAWDYLACLHRGGQAQRFAVWRVGLHQSLPRIIVPLADEDRDVTLDLQAALAHCYEAGAFVRQIDYSQAPVPPLSAEDAEWADALLRERGLRS